MGAAKDRVKTVLLFVASCAIALIVAELVARIFLPVEGSAYVYDERYIYTSAPHTRTWFTRSPANGGQRVLVEFNALGYRGEEPDLSPGRVRIAVYGDSFIDGGYSPLAETFAAQLEEMLSAGGMSRVQVLNAGTGGYGPDQLSLRIEDEIDLLQPSAIVLSVFTGNDFGDLLRNKMYRREDGELVVNRLRTSEETRARFEDKRRLFSAERPWNRSMLLRALMKLHWDRREVRDRGDGGDPAASNPRYMARLLRARQREYRKYVLEGNNEVRLGSDGYDADVALLPDSESARYKLALMAQLLARIDRFLADRGIPLLLLIVPSPIDACDGHPLRVDGAAYPSYSRSGPTSALEDAAKRHGIPYLNLFPHFHGERCPSLFFRAGNDHWNARGQALAAGLVAELLLSGEILGREGPRSARSAGSPRP